MSKNKQTRRTFLKSAGITAIALHSSVSISGELSGKTFDFVQLCDTQLGFGGYEHDVKTFKQAVKQINAMKPDFAVICGDLVNKVSEKSYRDFNKIKADLTIPCHCVPGNHDVGQKATLESLQYYRTVVGKDYYSFEHKGYVFVIVNTQLWKAPVEDESKKQDLWLETTLENASSKGSRIFVLGHYPLFTKKPDEREAYYNLPSAKRKNLLDLFEKHGVVAVLTGHAHRIIINEYKGIQLVTGQATSRTSGSPLGFRVWHVKEPKPFAHESVPIAGF